MTIEEIDAMPAGREMDAAVGRVMGVEPKSAWVATTDKDLIGKANIGKAPPKECADWLAHQHSQGLMLNCVSVNLESWPEYSTNWFYAGQVAEWLRKEFGGFNLEAGFTEWRCMNRSVRNYGYGATPQLAICRAALLAHHIGSVN